MSTLRRTFAVLAPLSFLTLSPSALAQEAPGFAINRFDPSERGSDWFALESLDLRGEARLAFGVVGDWSHRPLVLYAPDGSVRSSLIKDQLFLHVGGGIILAERLRLAVNLPVAVHQQGARGTVGTATYVPPDQASVGDLRVGADLRLFGEYGGAFTTALGVQVHVPTGNQADYTSDGKVRVVPRLLGAGEIGPFAYALKLGVQYRSEANFANSPVGTEFLVGAAAGLHVADKKLMIGPEVYGSTVLTNDASFKKLTSPLELLFGARFTFADDFRIGAGVGPGLTRGIGTPELRVVGALEWFPAIVPPPPPPSDRDNDGIIDNDDACPDVFGVRTEDPKTNGCPAPPADRDKDGILDAEDACPDTPGVKTDDPKTNGCPPPPPDRDKDGIPDPEDACPDSPGPRNEDPKKNGCPEARIEAGEIKILQQVKFKTNSAEILPESDGILNAVAKILTDHPEITNVRIEGHTDNRGGAAMNLGLSGRRAASVLNWLVRHGVEKSRLSSKGFGLTRPIDSNTTEEGRQNNRRVEFHIDSGGGQKK
jgi:outer membrane protein OmpA-like peptidoglycan-associated protein